MYTLLCMLQSPNLTQILPQIWGNMYVLLYCKVQSWHRSYLKRGATYTQAYTLLRCKVQTWHRSYLKCGATYMFYYVYCKVQNWLIFYLKSGAHTCSTVHTSKSKLNADPTSKVGQHRCFTVLLSPNLTQILPQKWGNIYALMYCKVQNWHRSYLKSGATYML